MKITVKIFCSIATLSLFGMSLSGQPIVGGEFIPDQVDSTSLDSTMMAEEVKVIRGLAPFRDSLILNSDSMQLTMAMVHEDASARRALEPYENRELNGLIDGYRVGVYFNNSATARTGAMDVMNRCDSLLKDLIATMSYANPYFKVSVGYCTSPEEAVILLNRVQRYFPKAYLMREKISVDNIIQARAHELNSREIDPEMSQVN